MKRLCISVLLLLPLAIVAGCVSTQPYQTKKSVTSLAFSPDRALLAFADAKEIRVLEVESKKHFMTLRQLPPDTKHADPQFYRHGVGDNMLFLDNDRIASTGMGGLVSIWNVRSGRRLAVIDPLSDEEFASTIDYSPATGRMVIGTSAGQVFLTNFNGDKPAPLVPFTQLEGYVWDLQFGRDGRYFASASLVPPRPGSYAATDEAADQFASMMAEESPGASTVEVTEKPADETVNELAVDASAEPADEFAQVQNSERSGPSNVVIWDAEQLEVVGTLEGAIGVYKMSLVPGQRALLTAGDNIQVWEFLTLEQAEEISDPSMVLQAIGFGTIAMVSVAGLAAGVVPPVDFLTQSFLNAGYPFIPTVAFIQHACARAAAISPDGDTIVSTTLGPTHNVMAVIDRKENKVVEKWTAESSVCDMQFSLDGRYLLAATSRGVYIFDTLDWKKTNLKKLITTD